MIGKKMKTTSINFNNIIKFLLLLTMQMVWLADLASAEELTQIERFGRPLNAPGNVIVEPQLLTLENYNEALAQRIIPADINRDSQSTEQTDPRVSFRSFALASSQVGSDSSPASPTSITELARALKNNPDLIYEFVHNNIEFIPQFGIVKGAEGALLDNRGTAFDQSLLLVELLKEAGYTNAKYVVSGVDLTGAQIKEWFGLDDIDTCAFKEIAQRGRIPLGTINGAPASGDTVCETLNQAFFLHVWVEANIDGTDYVFDPSFKRNEINPGIDLAAVTGYDKNTHLSQAIAGATVTADTIQNLNRTAVRNNLNSYANNLVDWLRTNQPNASLSDVLGGAHIIPEFNQARQTTLPYSIATDSDKEIIPSDQASLDAYRILLQYRMYNSDADKGASAYESFFSDELYGSRVTVTYSGNQPVFKRDGQTIPTNWPTASGTNQILERVIYFSAGNSHYREVDLEKGGTFFVIDSAGGVSRGLTNKFNKDLASYRAAGQAEENEPVLGTTLAILAQQYSVQLSFAEYYLERFNNIHIYETLFGVTGHRPDGSVYIDLPGVISGYYGQTNQVEKDQNFLSGGFISSVLESTVVSQALSSDAASTITLLDTAIKNNRTILRLTQDNYVALRPTLAANCSAGQMASIDSAMQSASLSVVADTCNIQIGESYSGFGDITVRGKSIRYGISGGLSGGFSSVPLPPSDFGAALMTNTFSSPVAQTSTSTPEFNYSTINSTVPTSIYTALNTFNDPIDIARGNFIYSHTDFGVGSTLVFSRLYSSGLNYVDGPVGKGWDHNFNISISEGSDGLQTMGEDSALDAVPMLIERMITTDLLLERTATNIAIAVVGTNWLGEQLADNIVSVKQGMSGEVFVRLPDGTFNPPSGSTSRLTFDGTQYVYESVNKDKLTFNPASTTNGSLKAASYEMPNGYQVRYSYTGDKLSNVKDSYGHQLTFGYNGDRIDTVSDGHGRSVQYAYDANGNLDTYTDPENAVTNYDYNADGRMTQFFYPSNPTVASAINTYDTLGRVKTQTNALGAVYDYYFAGYRSEEVSRFNAKSLVSYLDNRGNIYRTEDPLKLVTEYEFDNHNRLVKKTMPEGDYVSYEYDDATCASAEKRCTHNVRSVTAYPKPGSTLAPIVQSSTYEPEFNKIATSTDAKLQTTNYTYTSFGAIDTITLPADQDGNRPFVDNEYTAYASPAPGFPAVQLQTKVTTKIDNARNVIGEQRYHVDSNNKLVLHQTISDVGGVDATSTFTYNAVGDLTNVDGPRTDVNDVVTTQYDNARRPFLMQNGLNQITRYEYDQDGRMLKSAQQYGAQWMVSCNNYTVTGKTATSWGPALTSNYNVCPDATALDVPVTTFDYDVTDRLDTTSAYQKDIAAAQFRTTKIHYNVKDQVVRVEKGYDTALAQNDATYTYTDNGLQETVTDAKANKTTYEYDGFDRLQATIYPNVTSSGINLIDKDFYGYDANSNVTYIQKRGWIVARYFDYDNLNRLIGKRYYNSDLNVTYTYDLRGLMTSAYLTAGGNTISYDWDNAGRLKSTTSGGRKLSYAYNKASQRERITWPDNQYIYYKRDPIGRIEYIQENAQNGTTNVLANYEYDTLNRRKNVTLGNGTTTAYTYNARGYLETLTHNLGSVQEDIQYTYSYNQLGNITNIGMSNNRYLWQPSGTNTPVTYDSNELNQYKSSTFNGIQSDHRYDGSGNLTSYDLMDAETGIFYGFDIDNRLDRRTLLSEEGFSVSTVQYDAESRLHKLIIDGEEKTFLYDGQDLVAEYDAGGTMLKRYVHGPGVDEPLVDYDGAGMVNKNWFYADHQGTIIAEANNTGTTTAFYQYGPTGAVIADREDNSGRFGYTGQVFMREFGTSELQLHYYKARMYLPHLGRFLQPDPIGYDDGMNMYTYVGNNWVNYNDPSGTVALIDNAIGGGIGFGVDLFAQWGEAGFQSFDYDYIRGGIAIGTGFATSGVSAFVTGKVATTGGRIAANGVVSGGGNATQQAANNYHEGKDIGDGVVGAFITGGLLGSGSTYGAGKLASSIIARNSSNVLNSTTPGAYNFIANIAENSGATLGKSPAAAVIGSQGGNVLSAFGNVLSVFK